MSKKSRSELSAEITSGWASGVSVGPQGIMPVKKSWMEDMVDSAFAQSATILQHAQGVGQQAGAFSLAVDGGTTPVVGIPGFPGPAGATYTAAEQALINEVINAINANNGLIDKLQVALGAVQSQIVEIQIRQSIAAAIFNRISSERDSPDFRGEGPSYSLPSGGDVPTLIHQTSGGGVRRGVETEIGAANVGDLEPKWSTPYGPAISMVPTVVNDVAYVGDVAGKVSAWFFDGDAPVELWSYSAGASILSSIAVGENTVAAFDGAGYAHGIDRRTGEGKWRIRPNPHPASAFFGGQGTIDFTKPAGGWLYFGVPSFQETLMAFENGFAGVWSAGSAAGALMGAVGAIAPNTQTVTILSGPFTDDALYREISIDGAAVAGNSLRKRLIVSVIDANTVLVTGTDSDPLAGGAETLPGSATYQVTSPFLRQSLGLIDDPPDFKYPIGGSHIGTAHCVELDTGRAVWTRPVPAIRDFIATTPGLTNSGALVVKNVSGADLGYYPDVPGPSGYNAWADGARALDVFGNQRYNLGPSGGGMWGAINIDPALNIAIIPVGEQQSPPYVEGPSGLIAVDATTGEELWRTQLSQDADEPDIWDDGLGTRAPDILSAQTLTDMSAPDSDGFQLVTTTETNFVAHHGKSGRTVEITGMANAENNGHFAVASYEATNQLKILNPGGVVESGASGSLDLYRALDLDIGCTPLIVETTPPHIAVGGKDGRLFVLDMDGNITFEKQVIQNGLIGGWQTGAAQDGDIIYLAGTSGAQVGRDSQTMNASLDILRAGPGVVMAFQIDNSGLATKLWERFLTWPDLGNPGFPILTGPSAGQTLTSAPLYGCMVANGLVYVMPLGPQYLVALDASDGSIVASIPVNPGEYTGSIPTISNGRVYMPSGAAFATNFRFPIEFQQLFGNLKVFGLP